MVRSLAGMRLRILMVLVCTVLVMTSLAIHHLPIWAGFGHNGVISRGSTAGFGDDVDIFAEQLSAEKPGYYLHNGKWVKMLSREETITVKNGQAETFTVWRTVHGNILQTDQTTQTAYAKSRARDGKEVASLLAGLIR